MKSLGPALQVLRRLDQPIFLKVFMPFSEASPAELACVEIVSCRSAAD